MSSLSKTGFTQTVPGSYLSNLVSKSSCDRDATASPGKLLLYLTIHINSRFFLMSNVNLPCCGLSLLLVLSLVDIS